MYNILTRFKYNKFSPSVNEWINSYYSFNNNILNNSNSLVYLLFNSYFNSFLFKKTNKRKKNYKLYSYKKYKKMFTVNKLKYLIKENNFNIRKESWSFLNKRKKIVSNLRFITRKCSKTLKRIFISIPEIKFYMNCICINLYVFNKQKYLILKKLKTIKRKPLIFSKSNNKNIYDKFIYYNIDNKSFLEQTISKRLIETFFYRKYILDLYNNRFKFNVLKLVKIKHILANVYNKHIILNIINAKYLFVDNNILLEAIVRKLKNRKRRVLRVMRKAIYLSKVYNIDPLLLIKLEINNIVTNYNNIISNLGNFMFTKKIKFTIFEYLKNTHVVGIRLEANGRLSKRLTASRSVHKIAYYGKIQNIYSSKQEKSALMSRGFLKSNVEYLNKNSFNRIGSYGITSNIATL